MRWSFWSTVRWWSYGSLTPGNPNWAGTADSRGTDGAEYRAGAVKGGSASGGTAPRCATLETGLERFACLCLLKRARRSGCRPESHEFGGTRRYAGTAYRRARLRFKRGVHFQTLRDVFQALQSRDGHLEDGFYRKRIGFR